MTIIAKNPGVANVGIEDLGIIIKPGEQRELDEFFSLTEITESDELKSKVISGDIVINDGTQDLSVSDALSQLKLETAFEDLEQDETISGDRNVDGGRSDSVYLPTQVIDGGASI